MAQIVKNPPAMHETWVRSLDWEDPLEKRIPTPVFLPGKSHGQRSLVGYSPWGHKESDTTERLTGHFSVSCIMYNEKWAFLVAQLVKNLPTMQETPVRFLGQEDPLERG